VPPVPVPQTPIGPPLRVAQEPLEMPTPSPAAVTFHMLPVMGTLLAADADGANGLEVGGGFLVRNGQLVLDLVFMNHTTQAVGPFLIKFNKNTFQVTPAASINLQSLEPGETKNTSLGCNFTNFVEVQPPDLVQVALKTNLGVAFFAASLPLYRLFVSDGRLEKDQYYKIWRSIQNEQCSDIADIVSDDVNRIQLKLEAYNIFFVASRSVSDEEFLYVSAKSLDGSVFLMELGFQGTLCKLCTKTEAASLVPLLAQSIQLILTS